MVGIDEVGRGAWAGPLLVAAVRLHEPISGLTDSKLLTKKRREVLAPLIQQHADIGLGWIDAATLDVLGMTAAMKQAALDAVTAISDDINEEIIIDGSVNFLPPGYKVTTQPKAELSYPSVAAASIIAKVLRDRYMGVLSLQHPNYSFETHVGYGTKQHMDSLQAFGALKFIHRFSFAPIKGLGP